MTGGFFVVGETCGAFWSGSVWVNTFTNAEKFGGADGYQRCKAECDRVREATGVDVAPVFVPEQPEPATPSDRAIRRAVSGFAGAFADL